MPPKVSVVIPVFNRPEAVRRAIASVLAQTQQDFEIIVVDDGSTDTTAASIAAIADPRITLVRHEKKQGGSAARNTGVRASSAPFVAFLDSDDEWFPTKLDRQLELFERSTAQLGLVYSGKERVYADGSVSRHIPRPHLEIAKVLLTENVVGETSLGMVRRDALDAIGGFDENLPSSQDLDLWLRISERFSAEAVPEVLVRVAKGGDVGRITANPAGMTRGRELFCEKHGEKMRREGVLHKYLRESGWVYQRQARDPRLARRRYVESLRAKPIAPLTLLLLFSACMPLSWLDALALWKHRVSALLQSTYSAVAHGSRSSSAPVPAKRTE
jgi:O-antigen biosynthesis protein